MKDNPVTLDQIVHLNTLLTQHSQGGTHLQQIYESGYFSDLIKANGQGQLTAERRIAVQKVLGIEEKETAQAPAEIVRGCLKLVSGAETISLDADDGTVTLANAVDVFTGYLDSDFENYGTNVHGPEMPAINVQVWELIKNGNFKTIFAGIINNPSLLCIGQGQVKQFPQKFGKWVRSDRITFVPFKVKFPDDHEEIFVAGLNRYDDGRLRAFVCRFSGGDVWFAGYGAWFVLPQLEL